MPDDPLVLAYLAGVIDSDGFVSIARSVHKAGINQGRHLDGRTWDEYPKVG